MTPENFRALIAQLAPGAVAKPVQETIQYRVAGKTFATLGWPTRGCAVLKLSQTAQREAMARSDALERVDGRARSSGITLARLAAIDEAVLADVIAAAWREAYRGPEAKVARPRQQRTMLAAE